MEGVTSKWADIEDEVEDRQEITTKTEQLADGSVIKTVVEYKSNDKGQKVKVVKKIRVYKATVKVNKRVEQRKKWKKFGDCTGLPKGPENGVTNVGEEISIEVTGREKEAKESASAAAIGGVGVVCRKCKGDHWTVKCPYKDKLEIPSLSDKESLVSQLQLQAQASGSGSESGKYVPPGLKSKMKSGESELNSSSSSVSSGGSSSRPPRDENATIRVTNLSEDTKESDISELFRAFGPIQRIYLAKDKDRGSSKGFAFVSFVYKKDAAKAIEKLSGYGYDHLILRVEWAKPSNPK